MHPTPIKLIGCFLLVTVIASAAWELYEPEEVHSDPIVWSFSSGRIHANESVEVWAQIITTGPADITSWADAYNTGTGWYSLYNYYSDSVSGIYDQSSSINESMISAAAGWVEAWVNIEVDGTSDYHYRGAYYD